MGKNITCQAIDYPICYFKVSFKSFFFFIRFVEDDAGIQPSTTRHYSLPQDIVDIAGTFLRKFLIN